MKGIIRKIKTGFIGYLAFVSLTFTSLQMSGQVQKSTQIINDNWEFRESGTEKWADAVVPGSVQLSLLTNGDIDDPFYGTNELKDNWISEKNWEFRTKFVIDHNLFAKDEIELVFEGLDTYAKVYLNGNLIQETDNYFRTWKVNIREWAVLGSNALQIFFYSPEKKIRQEWENLGYELPGGIRTMTRKPAFHYGWDWGPRMVTMGISGDVKLIGWNRAKIEYVHYQQGQIDKEQANLSVNVAITSTKIQKVVLTIETGKNSTSKKVKLRKGINRFSIPFTINDPKLWWSRGLGDQHMYDFTASISQKDQNLDIHKEKIGLRTIELVVEPDEKGQTFYFKLNGIPVFMKGANYIPTDIMQGRIGSEQYQRVIQDAVDANMNMLRVWGGGIYEKDEFYDLCDANGLLVWQDFMFACAMYPGGEKYIASVEQEAIDNIRRLRNHPSIALWCGNNEVSEGWHRWGWQDAFNNKQKNRIWNDYKRIFQEVLPAMVEAHDPGATYWESSPKFGRGNPQHQFEGDSHYWGVWHDAEPFEMFEAKVPRFMSEFGFQSFPEMSTIRAFAEEGELSLHSEVMKTHQKHPRGNSLIVEYMGRDFQVPEDFSDFVYVSQIVQAEGMRIGLEAHRRSQPYCMGTLYWQLNDCWPVASWSSVDYFGNWKALHYFTKKTFASYLVSPVVENETFNVYLVSEKLQEKKAKIKVRIRDLRGKIYEEFEEDITILPNQSMVAYSIPEKELFNPEIPQSLQFVEVLLMPFTKENQRSFDNSPLASGTYFPRSPKDTELLNPSLVVNTKEMKGGYRIDISAKTLARFVRLETDVKGRFSDNYFDVMPGEKVMIFFKTEEAVNDFRKRLSVKSLFDVR